MTDPTPPDATQADWGRLKRVLFRFAAVYVVLYALPFPFRSGATLLNHFAMLQGKPAAGADPTVLESVSKFAMGGLGRFMQLQHEVVAWVAQTLLRMDYEIPKRLFTGSGDRTFNYIYTATLLGIAGLVCLIWSLADRRRRHYRGLSRFVSSFARYYLAFFMLTYGGMKVVKLQFPDLNMSGMLKPFGDVTPMELVWKFMGHSDAYTSFSGIGEVTAALLLFFRTTRTLGAMVTIGVMSNVVMMNYAYRIPVKLFSSHLLILAFVFLWLDRHRFIAVFLRNRAAEPADHSAPLPGRQGAVVSRCVQGFIIAGLLFNQSYQTYRSYERRVARSEVKPPLYGLYDVESYKKGGADVPPLLTDVTRWQNLLVEYEGQASVRGMDSKSYRRFTFEVDEEQKTVRMAKFVFRPPGTPPPKDDSSEPPEANFTYEVPGPGQLLLKGKLDGELLEIALRTRDLEAMNCNRKFRWILERPYEK